MLHDDRRLPRRAAADQLHADLSLGEDAARGRPVSRDQLDRRRSSRSAERRCSARACSLLQIAETVDPEILFCRSYPYFSSVSPALMRHFRRQRRESIIERMELGRDSLVVEAASNDGYMLRVFHERGIPVLGIDPADGPAASARAAGIPTLNTFFSERRWRRSFGPKAGCADVFLANNVLAHVADLNGFVEGIATRAQAGRHRRDRVPLRRRPDRACASSTRSITSICATSRSRRSTRCSAATGCASITSSARRSTAARCGCRFVPYVDGSTPPSRDLLAAEREAGESRPRRLLPATSRRIGDWRRARRAARCCIDLKSEGKTHRRLRRGGEGDDASRLLRHRQRPARLRRRSQPFKVGRYHGAATSLPIVSPAAAAGRSAGLSADPRLELRRRDHAAAASVRASRRDIHRPDPGTADRFVGASMKPDRFHVPELRGAALQEFYRVDSVPGEQLPRRRQRGRGRCVSARRSAHRGLRALWVHHQHGVSISSRLSYDPAYEETQTFSADVQRVPGPARSNGSASSIRSARQNGNRDRLRQGRLSRADGADRRHHRDRHRSDVGPLARLHGVAAERVRRSSTNSTDRSMPDIRADYHFLPARARTHSRCARVPAHGALGRRRPAIPIFFELPETMRVLRERAVLGHLFRALQLLHAGFARAGVRNRGFRRHRRAARLRRSISADRSGARRRPQPAVTAVVGADQPDVVAADGGFFERAIGRNASSAWREHIRPQRARSANRSPCGDRVPSASRS